MVPFLPPSLPPMVRLARMHSLHDKCAYRVQPQPLGRAGAVAGGRVFAPSPPDTPGTGEAGPGGAGFVRLLLEQRRQFILELMRLRRGGAPTFCALCARFGVSQKTGRKWRTRFEAQGAAGLVDKSRRPHGNARALPRGVVARFVALKRRYPDWGPQTLRALYAQAVPLYKEMKIFGGIVLHL